MDRKINAFWAVISVLVVFAALVLCVYGSFSGVLYARPNGNPQNAVTGFFNYHRNIIRHFVTSLFSF